MNLLCTGAFPLTEKERDILSSSGWLLTFHPDETQPVANPMRYDAVICNGLFLHQPAEDFSSLKIVQLTSAGTERVPGEYFRKKGVRLYNAGDAYALPMAEWAVGGILALYKGFFALRSNQQNKIWQKNRQVREIAGKQVLIYGFGNTGKQIARLLSSFGCRITGVGRTQGNSPLCEQVAGIQDADRLLPGADIVICTLPLTKETTGYFGKERFDRMENRPVFVNLSRGDIVKETDLTEALREGKISGAVLDVFQQEPLPEDSPLWDMENVLISPHNSFVGEGSHDRLFAVIRRNLTEFLTSAGNPEATPEPTTAPLTGQAPKEA